MAHQRNRANRRARLQPRQRRAKGIRLETQPVHAGIELEEDIKLDRQAGGGQHFDLFGTMHYRHQMVFGQRG